MDSHAPAFLSVHDIHAYYGESYIVQGVSFNVHEGEILALLGRNGAGKTSTLRTIARLDDPALVKGEIWLDHKHLHTMSSHEAAVNGIALVPEDRRIIPGLTVEENLQLAQIVEPIGWGIDRIYELFPRLGERRKQEGVTLSRVPWPVTLRFFFWMNLMKDWRLLSLMKSKRRFKRSNHKASQQLSLNKTLFARWNWLIVL
jgi:branched-chain amino acid transport system ATP-binding protein